MPKLLEGFLCPNCSEPRRTKKRRPPLNGLMSRGMAFKLSKHEHIEPTTIISVQQTAHSGQLSIGIGGLDCVDACYNNFQ